ncbi:unnamed protein product [Leptidea sinapis]|uniref:Uncharacterized protein n=1 Tax=Leptidea sinapis TaxID=189913 RepID=A0A5E4Q9Z8_9NEOP|nr:unnamed protein product [Leptidea sinapis]
MLLYLFVCLSVIFQGTLQLVPLPDFIHPCAELTDECFTKATLDALPGVVKGIPEAGIPSLDPLYLDKNITMNLPGNKRTFVFDIHCNFTIRGQLDVLEKVVRNEQGEGHYKINSYKCKYPRGAKL